MGKEEAEQHHTATAAAETIEDEMVPPPPVELTETAIVVVQYRSARSTSEPPFHQPVQSQGQLINPDKAGAGVRTLSRRHRYHAIKTTMVVNGGDASYWQHLDSYSHSHSLRHVCPSFPSFPSSDHQP